MPMLMNDVSATYPESPAPRKQPEITTCEGCIWHTKARIIIILEPNAITSASFENRCSNGTRSSMNKMLSINPNTIAMR